MLASLLMELRFAIEGGGDPRKSFRCGVAGAVLCFRVLFLHVVGRGLEE